MNETASLSTTLWIPTTAHTKPRLRGWIHAIAACAVIIVTPLLIVVSPEQRKLVMLMYSGSLIELYTVSAAFHLGRWRGVAHVWLRLLDHASIFVAIAGADTAFVALSPRIGSRWLLLGVVWGAAVAGIVAKICHRRMSRTLSTTLYLAMGWASVWIWLSIRRTYVSPRDLAPLLALMALAGLVHSCGAIVYARRWPDPWPSTFGYHEFFHALVVLGNLLVSIAVIHLALA